MINKSFNELLTELAYRDPHTGETGKNAQGISMQLSESGGKCNWCKKKIKRSHKSWGWRFDDLVLRMHLNCFTYWFMAVVPDAEKAADLTGGESGK